jgi:DNA-binding MarR family transcriptional regulator
VPYYSAMQHHPSSPAPAAIPAPAPWRHLVHELRPDDAGRLYSPAMRERFRSLGSSPDAEALAAVSVADKALASSLEGSMADLGLSLAQFRALLWIRQSGRAGTHMRLIADACNVTPRTITGVVDGLEAAGLVERVPDPADRRAVIARLTEEGARRFDAARTRQEEVARRLLTALEPEEREVLRDLCLRLVRSAAALAAREAGR